MAVFEYKALTVLGQTKKGVLEGDSERQIRQMLRDEGLSPVTIKSMATQKSSDKSFFSSLLTQQIKVSDLSLFTRELYTLLDASIPLNQALKSLSEQSDSKLMTRFVTGLHTHVSEGYSLAMAMRRSSFRVSQEYVAIIQAGEESGYLDKVLSRLADAIEQREQLNKKLKTALIYPVLMVVVAITIVIFLMVYVVPKVVSVFDNMDQALPPLTQGLLDISAFMQNYAEFLILLLIALVLMVKWMLRQAKWRFKIHSMLLKTPGIKRFLIYSETARWARTLAVLLSSGVNVKEALTISVEVMTLDPLKQSVLNIVAKVREGKSVYHSMESEKIFPPLLMNLVKTGEGKGQLDNMLLRGAKHYESAVENAAETMMSILEPVMIIVMGGVVLLIVLAIMMPIFEMNQMISG
ncbi:MAG: type II secretion system inner membrane protein GspF [Pseudomonadota bacterium]